jgi:DNA-binding response OmpR family regulator
MMQEGAGSKMADEKKVIRVLMVDDNKEHVNLCAEYLPKDGFALDPAYDAMEALVKIKENKYDIIVLDYALPDMNGIDLMKKIKPLNLNVPMIFVSAYDDPDLSFEAMRAGACDYVVKTFQYYESLKERILENIDTCPVR